MSLLGFLISNKSHFRQLLETYILVKTLTDILKTINKFPGNVAEEDNRSPNGGPPEQGALQPASDATPLPAEHTASHGPTPGLPLTRPQEEPPPAGAALPVLAPGAPAPAHFPAREPPPARGRVRAAAALPAPRGQGRAGRGGVGDPRGGAGGRAPGEGEGHEAEDGEAEEGDGVRPVEELQRDVLHLLLVDHAEVQAVVHVVLAQGPAPHARRHLAPFPSPQRGSGSPWRGAARPEPARPEPARPPAPPPA